MANSLDWNDCYHGEIYLNDIFNQMIGTEQIDSVEMHDFC